MSGTLSRKSTPEPPGPPGLVTREPIRSPLAATRPTAISMSPESGASQARGTVIVPHSTSSPSTSSQGPQSIDCS